MLGESPKTIPVTFKKTKYPSIEQQMHNLIHDREESLAAHELAMRRIADRQKNTFTPFKKGDKVWLDTRNIKTTNNPKIGPQRKGPFEISDVLGPLTYQLNLLTSWQIHNVFHTILLWPYRKQDSWSKFPSTSSRTPWRRRCLWSWVNHQTPTKRTGTSIPRKMERLPNYWCNMGKQIGIFQWWWHAVNLQRLTSTITVNMT